MANLYSTCLHPFANCKYIMHIYVASVNALYQTVVCCSFKVHMQTFGI